MAFGRTLQMRTVRVSLCASLRYCGLVGLAILPLTVLAQQATGQEGTMRPRGEGMGMGGMGTGLAIGIGTGLLIDQLNKPADATDNKKAGKAPKTEKRLVKQPPPKQDKPPPKTPVDNPI